MTPEGPPADLDALCRLAAIELPEECVAGVRTNLALLAEHWRNLEDFAVPEDAK